MTTTTRWGAGRWLECYLDRGRQKGDDAMRAMVERIGVRASLSGEVSHSFRELIKSVGWRLGLLASKKRRKLRSNKLKSKINRTSLNGIPTLHPTTHIPLTAALL